MPCRIAFLALLLLAAAASAAPVVAGPIPSEAAPPAPARAPSGATTTLAARLAPVGLPDARHGAREVRYAFGKDPEPGLRAVIREALVSRKSFSALVEDGGDVLAEFSVREARQEWVDLGVLASRQSPVRLHLTLGWSFTQGAAAPVAGEVQATGTVELDRQPFRSDARLAFSRALEQAVLAAFAQAVEAGALGGQVGTPGWIGDTPPN